MSMENENNQSNRGDEMGRTKWKTLAQLQKNLYRSPTDIFTGMGFAPLSVLP
jgi:hypothetical protein